MNQSTGLSNFLLNKFLCNKQTKSTEPKVTENIDIKGEPVLDEYEGHSSSDDSANANSDINDLNYLSEEELKLLKHKPIPNKKHKPIQNKKHKSIPNKKKVGLNNHLYFWLHVCIHVHIHLILLSTQLCKYIKQYWVLFTEFYSLTCEPDI